MKCKNCKNLNRKIEWSPVTYKYPWCYEINDSPDIEIERECEYCDTMTNADRIRNMTDEELAEYILSTPAYETCIKFCKNREECCEIMDMDDDIPTAFDVEAVVKDIQDIGTRFCASVHCNDECECCDHGSMMKAIIEIVRNGGAK